MILAIDVGNTNIIIGAVEDGNILFKERISADRSRKEVEYALNLKLIMEIHGIDSKSVDGGIISCVVPSLSGIIQEAVKKIFDFTPIIVGPGIKTGLNIALDNPAEIGADSVANAVASINEYSCPIIIAAMGTANTISVIDENKKFIGGLIAPGAIISLDALTNNASLLNDISIDNPKDIVGTNTRDCMKNGVVYGNAAMIDGLIERIENKLGTSATVVATGDIARFIVPFCQKKILRDDNLLLKGLWIIYNKNIRIKN